MSESSDESSELDEQQAQSIMCRPFDPFSAFRTAEVLPQPAAGVIDSKGVLRNSSLEGNELLRYTSAGESVKTLYDTFQFGVERNKTADCLGRRADADSPYVFNSYEATQAEAQAVGAFLKSIGVSPNECVGLSGKNAPEYLTAIQGCFWAGATTVPIYDTFGETECKYIIDEANVQAVFVSAENLSSILKWTEGLPFVKKIIVWGTNGKELVESQSVISYEQCIELGKGVPHTVATPPEAEDLAMIMYTSGTTGMPKGVMLPHSALVACIASLEKYFVLVGGEFMPDDTYVSYLPLAHVFDFYCECFILFKGAKIGYYRGDVKTLVDDLGVLKPTFFVGVPRVFEKVYKRVDEMVQNGSTVKKMLFNYFFEQKRSALARGVKFDEASYLGDQLVFSKIKNRLGGRVRFICSGGAPLPKHIEEWLKVTMCCPVVQGYGLTETCAASCVATVGRHDQLGTVGPPLFSNEAKLVPVPDLGYDGTPEGGGELCFRGPSVTVGYYRKPEETAEALKADGWFHTGDIGKIVNGGCVKVVDRKKQLFKLSQGEYISPEKVEGIAAKSPLVGQIFVHGASTETCCIAVVVPSETLLEEYGGKDKAMQSQELKLNIVHDIDRVCRSENLKGFEIPKAVVLYGEPLTPESGFVTPSFKLKRPILRKHFAKELDQVYASLR